MKTRLHVLRAEREWSQAELAAHVGVARATINAIETGKFDQTILKSLISPLHQKLVLTCAATALRSSEILALRWDDVLWDEERIRVSKGWANGENGETKTDATDGYVQLNPVLAEHLRAWQQQTQHAKPADFVFPLIKACGRKPLYGSTFVADYLRPAAKKAAVHIEDGKGFGLTNCATA